MRISSVQLVDKRMKSRIKILYESMLLTKVPKLFENNYFFYSDVIYRHVNNMLQIFRN